MIMLSPGFHLNQYLLYHTQYPCFLQSFCIYLSADPAPLVNACKYQSIIYFVHRQANLHSFS